MTETNAPDTLTATSSGAADSTAIADSTVTVDDTATPLFSDDAVLAAVHATFTAVGPDIATLRASTGEELLMPVTEFLPGAAWAPGDTVVAARVVNGGRTFLSVTSPDLVRALFEGLVPEIRTGVVRIMGVARAPGIRTKIAVATTDATVDPVTSCVGRAAGRVNALRGLLGGERVDIIAWHPDQTQYVRNALAPAEVSVVTTVSDTEVTAAAPRHQMAAAVGESGLNSSLAGQLVGLTVTIVPA